MTIAGYDAFISYSHDADMDLAPAVRTGLQRLAKKWNRRRALSIFLDQSSLELTSELGAALDKRIEDTRWLVLLMSEVSAESEWVGAEIERWAEVKSKDQMALVLTSGEIVWDQEAGDFDYEQSTAVNEGMRGIYTGQDSEPLYLDLRWTKEVANSEKSLDLHHARFRSDIATLAAPVHGVAKDELEGEDLRQFKLARRLKRAAIAGLAILTVIAIAAGVVALIQRAEAIREEQRARSVARASDALNFAFVETDLAALLALESVRVANTPDARGALASVLSLPTRFLQRTDEHDAPVTAIAFSPDGRVAATGDTSGVIRVWDVRLDPLEPPQAEVRTTADLAVDDLIQELFVIDDADGITIGVVGASGDLFSVDVAAGSVEAILAPQAFGSAALSPDFSFLAGTGSDGFLYLYEIVETDDDLSFVEVDVVDVGTSTVTDLTFSPDETTLAWGREDTGLFVLWNAGSEPDAVQLSSDVTSIAFSPDNTTIAVGEVEGIITLIDRTDLSLKSEVGPRPINEPVDLAFKPNPDAVDGLTLASAHSNGDIILWTVVPEPGTEPVGFAEDTLRGHKEVTIAVAFAPNGRIASGSFDGEVIWWLDVALPWLGEPLTTTNGVTDMSDAAFVDPDHAAAFDDDTVWVWNLDSFEETDILDGEDVRSLDAANGSIVVGLVDGSALVLRPDGTEVARLGPAHQAPVAIVAMSSDGSEVVTVSSQEGARSVVIWNLSTNSERVRPTLPEGFEPETALYADDGVVWLGGSQRDVATVLKVDANSGEVLGSETHGDSIGDSVTALALSADAKTLATGGSDRRIRLWNTETFEGADDPFTGHREVITGIVFTDGGATLISSDKAGEVFMWDVSLRRQFGTLGGPSDGLNSLEISGEVLLAASEDDAVWTWILDRAVWRERACLLAGRNMTPAEWERYGDGSAMVRHCARWPFTGTGDGRVPEYNEQLTD